MTLMPEESSRIITFFSKNVFVEEVGITNLGYAVNNFSILFKSFIVLKINDYLHKFVAIYLGI